MIEAARIGTTVTYGELAELIGWLPVAVGPNALETIGRHEYQQGRPMLTALTVLQEGRVPSDGFWDLAMDLELFYPGEDRILFWKQESRRVYAYWQLLLSERVAE